MAAPTGIVYNTSNGFMIESDTDSAPARFLFVTLDGSVLGWAPEVDSRNGIVVVEPAVGASAAAYTGATMAGSGGRTLLYAADFAGAKIDVYDDTFAPVDLGAEAFVDPSVPEGYAPFGIQEMDGRIYVTWAKPAATGGEEEIGPGLGYVDVFDTDGALIDTVAMGGQLNAPWGLVMAPDDFGQYGGHLLVGNFGDGRITAYDADSYEMMGQLESADGEPIEIEGLWGLVAGNGRQAGDSNALYFAAGTDDETHGLFGSIDPK